MRNSLKLWRSRYSQERFAAVAGLDRAYMGAVERGEKNVSMDNIGAIARALGVEVYRLFQQEPDEAPHGDEHLREELAGLQEDMRRFRDDSVTERLAWEARFDALLRTLARLDTASGSRNTKE
jgi:transcriptional regulator with XRE-family HTH domain